MMDRLRSSLEEHQFCYLTTRGRSTGRPHRIEIWFAITEGRLYVNSGGGTRSDWVKNLLANPRVEVEIGDQHWQGGATFHHDSATHAARQQLAARYQGWQEGEPLSEWATQSLLIEIEIEIESASD